MSSPEELQLRVAFMILQEMVGRGAAILAQIRRRYVTIITDAAGAKTVRIRGSAKRKTVQGRGDYRPLDFTMYGHFEVKFTDLWWLVSSNLPLQAETVERLLQHLPAIGCKFCITAKPPKEVGRETRCTCDVLFLHPKPPKKWREADAVWYDRRRRGRTWLEGVMTTISEKAKLAGKYTNGSLRATTITELASADIDNRVIAQVTGQKGHEIINQYKKKSKMMTPEEKRKVGMLVSSSGRRTLRGHGNAWGKLDKQDNTGKVAKAFKLVQKGVEKGKMKKGKVKKSKVKDTKVQEAEMGTI